MFGIKVNLEYSVNTLVSKNIEVSNTLMCLNVLNTLV
jgi:hypothetical protein